MNPPEIKNVLEFALLAAGGPLDIADLRRLLEEDGADDRGIRDALETLAQEWQGRGLRLAKVADGWQFVSREGYLEYLRRLRPKKPARLSRQLMEVLAVIAYQQPATRGDIEQARGVSVSSMQIAALEEQGWIEEVGRRETPGRPILYGTTKGFLNDLAIASLDELPPLEPEDMRAGFDEGESGESESERGEGDSQNGSESESESEQSGESESERAAKSESESESERAAESESEQSGKSESERGEEDSQNGSESGSGNGGDSSAR